MHESTTRGFKRWGVILQPKIRKVGERRGFAVSRLFTDWHDIAGKELAAKSRPVEVKYGKHGFGATLVLLTIGAHALELDMQKETLRKKVNSIYGYNAIVRILITQTSPTGFKNGKVNFQSKRRLRKDDVIDLELAKMISKKTRKIHNEKFRVALGQFGYNALIKSRRGRV
ncbi:MAG: DciA family protein [Aestuariivita sp.]|nr:DciA family protein [Aestuariivita sp.]